MNVLVDYILISGKIRKNVTDFLTYFTEEVLNAKKRRFPKGLKDFYSNLLCKALRFLFYCVKTSLIF